MRNALVLAVLAALSSSPAMSQTPPPAPNIAPWDQEFLPPAPDWNGTSRSLIRRTTDPWATDFEKDPELNFSPDYAATRAWFDRLDASSELIRIEEFGVSPEGRPIYAVIASKDGAAFDPAKPVLLIQAGIHPGEIDGKDAGMMLLRDIAHYRKDHLLDGVNLILIPILSVDGHERASEYSRPNQRGPRVQGWRNTATNQNLNRDYMKLDQAEMRAVRGLIVKYPPDLYVDVHVTDGMDYQYDVTFGFNGENGAFTRSPASSTWLDDVFKPAMYGALEDRGHIPGELVFGVGDDPKAGLSDGGLGERFSNGWGAAAHVPTILIENHSLKPYDQRVLGTYVFIEAALRILADDGGDLRAAIRADEALRPAEIPANFEPDPTPQRTVAFKGIRYETWRSEASGREEIRWLGEPDPELWQVPFYGSRPTLTLTRPDAYWVPAHRADLIERLAIHGVRMERLDAPRTVPVDMLRLVDPTVATRTNEGHVATAVKTVEVERRDWTFPAGSVRVSTDQPLGDVVVLLLEPQSSESFFAWGLIPEVLNRVEYIEGYAIAPLADRMLAADPALKAEFEARLAADAAFAANGDARLQWFYERTPFYDDRFRLYPIARETR
ncbi:MAG: M14 family metallopeptidase [Alphaproteobacteria bacterium]|nr:M14 family metallopeptidase [Alphaproteobacteria bacterium]MBU1526231.1 M14 family metallopeptidase [Alphaproteobacteria bacterium]MBU2116442.1 M14 family metallopeptidase [Alphaproteobacteria bacterium]MBU2351388.1 M14 family metallopeptidase [Alphaproteobacteria bacterium]MBU2382090.1 M14 family metallopeptidase [Alphaproteobacteria bacterium]